MKIAILAFGTRGDVQPYIALAQGLKAAGHTVRMVTHQNYEALVTSYHLDFSPVIGNVQEIAESEEMRKLLEKGNFITITMRTAKEAERAAIQWMKDSWAACQGAELLIAGMGGLNIAFALAEKMKIPLVQAYVVPFSPTSAFPGALFPGFPAWLGNSLNRISHHVTQQMLWQGFRSADKKMRKELLGLPPAPFWGPYHSEQLRNAPILYGFSPSVIAKPADWASHIHVTGYWFLDASEEWTPPAALTQFLQAGPPPVYIGFGSMGNRNPEETVDLVLQALQKHQQRAILLAGWGGLRKENLPSHVLMVDSVPHSWLFSQVAAVVHHGGAGTTAAGLGAGVPSIIIPFFGDQPFWGKRIADLGVGPQPIPRKQLTAEKLAQAIDRALTDQTMRQRAAELGSKIQAENGVANAVAAIEKL
ncbi:MAG: glycosyltransferase [Caldilineaceae bacterium]